jgi:hypothetical protein
VAYGDFGELKILHYCDGNTVYVEHLPVKQMQLDVQPPIRLIVCVGSHCPAPVMIKSGIAAIAAARMITR